MKSPSSKYQDVKNASFDSRKWERWLSVNLFNNYQDKNNEIDYEID